MRFAKLARLAKLAIVLLSFSYAAFGQTGGVITGVISDPAGAVVPNAPVEARNSKPASSYRQRPAPLAITTSATFPPAGMK